MGALGAHYSCEIHSGCSCVAGGAHWTRGAVEGGRGGSSSEALRRAL